MECDQSFSCPSSPPTLELGEFLDGLLFSPEGTSILGEETLLDPDPLDEAVNESLVSQPLESSQSPSRLVSSSAVKVAGKSPALEAQSNVVHPQEMPSGASNAAPNLKKASDDIDDEATFVPHSKVTPKDVLCLRGNGGGGIPANVMFRQLISSNKEHFDNLSTQEKESFATNLWEELSEAGHRFLMPTDSAHYKVLDYGRSVRKCQFALRRCKIKEQDQLTTASNSFSFSRSTEPPKKKQKIEKTSSVLKERKFDGVARAAISKLLNRPELVDAMQESWGDGMEKRKHLLERQVYY
mmetsp:Transcript_12866/g.27804  ORF Transcript_12866/g.27804 Transcript_12866/m.27804 type:complete len:297 (+) Transcript_12866:36-926(+)